LVIIALYVGFKEALVMLAVAAIAYMTLKKWFTDSVGGITGDLLGAQCEITEVLLLVACAGFLQ
jgi:cobalamin synthase